MLFIFLLEILIPARKSSSLAFRIMYSAYKLNKQGDIIQSWHAPFPILIQSAVSYSNCCFLACIQVSQETGKVGWYSHPFKNFPQFVVIHTVKSFSIVNEADVLLEFSCFLYSPVYVGNLISGSSALPKSSLYIWKFSIHVLSKPRLKDFEHDLASNCEMSTIVW